jgi:prevent-host-death family protein
LCYIWKKQEDEKGRAGMQTLSATDIKQGFGAALDAAQREPIFIRKQNRDVAVLMSVQEFERLRGLRMSVFDHLADAVAAKAAARGMTDEILAQLMADVS